ncbi:MAG: SCO family protein [Verrucomicrobia bacterium]|nr:SCO family protein [Verrucomicrobiota bacterium]
MRSAWFKAGLVGWGLLLVTLAVLGGVGWGQWQRLRGEGVAVETLPVLGTVPDFSFTERSGRTVTLADLRGSVWVADFIFTRCGGPCPTMCAAMAALQRSLGGAPEVKLVSFSVDPDHDTPEVLARFAARFGASDTQWFFLTGNKSSIWTLANNGLKLAVTSDTPGELVHSTKFALVDRAGRIRGYYDGMDPAEQARLLPAISALLRESAP